MIRSPLSLVLSTLLCSVVAGPITALISPVHAEEKKAATEKAPPMPLQHAIKLPDATFDREHRARFDLPSLPARSGLIPVLRARIYIQTPPIDSLGGGFNYNAGILLNGSPLRLAMQNGKERLLLRRPSFKLLQNGQRYSVFSGDLIATMFGHNADVTDGVTDDGLGATFLLDLSDVARGVDGNVIEIKGIIGAGAADNNIGTNPEDGLGRAVDVEVGYLPANIRQTAVVPLPRRGAISAIAKKDALSLQAGKQGGFAFGFGGSRLLVETDLGVVADKRWGGLIADDKAAEPQRTDRPIVKVKSVSGGFDIAVQWPTGLALNRQLRLTSGNRLSWRETWKNGGSADQVVPFNHRFFIAGEGDITPIIGGNRDAGFLSSSAFNPTVFLGTPRKAGRSAVGFGWIGEDDWIRAIMQSEREIGSAQVQSRYLALAPGKSIDFDMSLQAQPSDSYWDFINGLRARWKVNHVTIPQAMLGSAPAKAMPGHGPMVQLTTPWLGLQFDLGAAGKLDEKYGSKPVPDDELRKLYSFEHRKAIWDNLKASAESIRAAAPGTQMFALMHPSMDVAYKPRLELYPFHGDEILMPDGQPFFDAHYSRAWLGDAPKNGWEVIYLLPGKGTKYLAELRERANLALGEAKMDGLYCDEFSFSGPRIYSRYDYRKWDGYSVLLDDEGNIKAKVTDNSIASIPNQLSLIAVAKQHKKPMLVNTAPATRAVNDADIFHWGEGGNGLGYSANMHLTTPLTLGNIGDPKTSADLMKITVDLLKVGTLQCPGGDLSVTPNGADNFIVKQYPITPRALGPGFIVGPERIVSAVSRTFSLPAGLKGYRLWRYDKDGKLLQEAPPLQTVKATQRSLSLQCPPDGIVIAELVTAAPAKR